MLIVKVPSSQGSLEKNIGCELAPEVLVGKLDKENLEIDSVNVIQNDIETTDANIYAKAKEVFGRKEKAIFLGGDHSITYSIFKAFSENFSTSSLVVFDAHADAMEGIKPVSHEDMNRELIDGGLLKKENLLLVGIRKIWKHEKQFLEKNKIQTISSEEIKQNFENSINNLKNFIEKQKNIYLSIDIDVLDPSVAPGTGYLERGGLNEWELNELIKIILNSGNVKGIDLVEVNPKKDIGEKTVKIALELLEKFISV